MPGPYVLDAVSAFTAVSVVSVVTVVTVVSIVSAFSAFYFSARQARAAARHTAALSRQWSKSVFITRCVSTLHVTFVTSSS